MIQREGGRKGSDRCLEIGEEFKQQKPKTRARKRRIKATKSDLARRNDSRTVSGNSQQTRTKPLQVVETVQRPTEKIKQKSRIRNWLLNFVILKKSQSNR
jgi:hypothetical protein